MKTLTLGPSGESVSALCLGTMHLGSKESDKSSAEILDRYLDAGGSFLDTANIYARWIPGGNGGDSEELLGRWMKDRGNRARLFLASKVGFPYQDVTQGLRREQIVEECEKSLRRLGVDTLDLYYAHVDDRDTPLEETAEAFDELVRSGKVRTIGASNFTAWRLAEARLRSEGAGRAVYCCLQQRHTYLRPKPGADFSPQLAVTDEVVDYCAAKDVRLLAYSPLLSGAYVRDDKQIGEQYHSVELDRRLEALDRVCAEQSATRNQVILAWLLHQSPAILPITSASSVAQIEENLGSLELSLSEEQLDLLNS